MRDSLKGAYIFANEVRWQANIIHPCVLAWLMRLISMNIRHGGGKRVSSILAWLENQKPDFIVLPEWRSSNDTELSSSLENQGFKLAKFSRGGNKDNGVLFAAKEKLEAKRVTPLPTERGELVLARFADFAVCAAYFPQNEHKRPFFKKLFESSIENKDIPFLIVGDINTGNNSIDLPKGATKFACADMFDALSNEYKMTDLWRCEHGDNAREWTWHSVKNGFRIDHAFCNQAFLGRFPQVRCCYNEEPRKKNMTDHSAVVVDFG